MTIQPSISSADSNTIKKLDVCFFSATRNGSREKMEFDCGAADPSGSVTDET
jgi:hypothetical protein